MNRLAVIIPALNEQPRIAQAVASAWEAGANEVWVVDGGSSDGTDVVAERAGARLIHASSGRARQMNAGARQADCDLLLFLHADCTLHPACGPQIRQAVAGRSPRRWGAFRQRITAPEWPYRLLERGNGWRARWLRMAYGDQALWTDRLLFEQLGGFPEEPLLEDLLWVRQARRLHPPALLDGPLFVDARRWQREGICRRTLRNWLILWAFYRGAAPQDLAESYRRHDLD